MIYTVVDRTEKLYETLYYKGEDFKEAQEKFREVKDYWRGEDVEPNVEIKAYSLPDNLA